MIGVEKPRRSLRPIYAWAANEITVVVPPNAAEHGGAFEGVGN